MKSSILGAVFAAVCALTASAVAQQCCNGSVSSYCTAGTSVQGCVPSISGEGQPNIAIPDGFDIVVSNVPGQRYGTVFYGFYSFISPWAPGSPSFKCIANPVQRMGNIPSGGTFGQCDGKLLVDFNSWMTTNPTSLGSPFVQGQTIRAQGWYRDPSAPGQTNLSDALAFTLCSGPFDTLPPVITTCASNVTIPASAINCVGVVPDLRSQVIATDNCSSLTVTQVPPPGTFAAVGSMPVVLRVRDETGNATTCAAVLTVQDVTGPTITICAPDQIVQAGPDCTAAVPDFRSSVVAFDACGGPVSLSQSPPAGTISSIAIPIAITITASDVTGNLTSCMARLGMAPISHCQTPLGFVAIHPGSFQMGSNAAGGAPYYNSANEQPVHQVTISYPFLMGATEVTQAQYAALMGTNPSYFSGANRPVEQVTWFDANGYCVALTAQQAALGNVPPGYQYRLPTEAEWEYACRAGGSTEFNVGSALFCNQAKIGSSHHSSSSCNSSSTDPVASYAPNAWGLYDMHGNVTEWCLDSFAGYSAAAITDPFVTGGSIRSYRGGGWYIDSANCRTAHRYGSDPNSTFYYFGFRVVLAPILVP